MARRNASPVSDLSASSARPMCRVVAWAVAWLLAGVFMVQGVIAPRALGAGWPEVGPEVGSEVGSAAQDRASCCSAGSCCCGGPDVCLCAAECPDTPLVPTRHEFPARPVDERALVAMLPRDEWMGVEMVRTPRHGVLLRASPRVTTAVRMQAIVGVWLT